MCRGREFSPLWYARGLSDIFPSSCLSAVDYYIREILLRDTNTTVIIILIFPPTVFGRHKK